MIIMYNYITSIIHLSIKNFKKKVPAQQLSMPTRYTVNIRAYLLPKH